MTQDDFQAHSPIIAFDDLIFACANLCELLEIENEALAAHDAETVRALTENKVALAKLYEQAMAPMSRSPALAETLEPEQREELLAMGRRLDTLLKTNALRLEAEMEAYQRVMDILSDNAKKQRTSVTNYGREGTFGENVVSGSSVAFNKAL